MQNAFFDNLFNNYAKMVICALFGIRDIAIGHSSKVSGSSRMSFMRSQVSNDIRKDVSSSYMERNRMNISVYRDGWLKSRGHFVERMVFRCDNDNISLMAGTG